MTSKKQLIEPMNASEAYVWIWLPGEVVPVVCGVIEADGVATTFTYASSYLQRADKISLSESELALTDELIKPKPGLKIAGALRDAAPDAWGRRVILNRKFGKTVEGELNDPLNEISYLLESGSDRIGALDFQSSPTSYISRPKHRTATLDELLSAAEMVDKGVLLTPELSDALQHGTSIGGARPKALIETDQKKFIAKFSATSDTYDVVKTEFVAMRLAALAGLNVMPVRLEKAMGKDVFLIERFDRKWNGKGYERRNLISALSLFELDEMMGHHASYKDLTDIIRHKFINPREALVELYRRLIFSILISNNDDHARNHAALWNGKKLELSPAYDLCPQKRTGREANQALWILPNDKRSLLEVAFEASQEFLISRADAIGLTEEIMTSMIENIAEVIEEAELSEVGVAYLKRAQIFNDYAFEDLKDDSRALARLRLDLK